MTPFGKRVAGKVRSVRKLLIPFYGNTMATHQKSDSVVDAVTELDLRVEDFLAEQLKLLDPKIDFVGEERGGNREAERFWLVDPIDGTAHFIRGMPFCTTMLALISENQVVLGAIYDFVNDRLYFAERGEGSTVNGEQIRVNNRSLHESYIAWETHVDRGDNLKKFLGLRDRSILFKLVCSGYEYMMVASGKLDGRICFDPYGKDYDFAPGSLLVAEAGGRVANIGVPYYDFRNLDFIAANQKVFKELTEGAEALFPLRNSTSTEIPQ